MNPEWNAKAEMLHKVKQARKYYEAMEKLYLEELKVLSGGKSALGETFELKMVIRPGAVEYSKIPELFDVCLDKYRKEDVVSWLLTEKIIKPEII